MDPENIEEYMFLSAWTLSEEWVNRISSRNENIVLTGDVLNARFIEVFLWLTLRQIIFGIPKGRGTDGENVKEKRYPAKECRSLISYGITDPL